jgi:hypothetical protein
MERKMYIREQTCHQPSLYLFPAFGPKKNTEELDIKFNTSVNSGSDNSKIAATDHAFG